LTDQNRKQAIVVGAGLAGSEAAWQLAERGIRVELHEMRPVKMTPAHHTEKFAELVCSNSLRSNQLENAVGLLKEEMRQLGSLIMECADSCAVPAGGALAVDREGFSALVTKRITQHPLITVVKDEMTSIPLDADIILATGPLTSEALTDSIAALTESGHLYFYDAAAPIVSLESLDMNKVYRASRYGKGDADYLNCPMSETEYQRFWEALTQADVVPLKIFEKEKVFEGCMPVETMARRGVQTLLFGPLKPVGLVDPATGREPYAVVQLRQDNKEGTLYNLVGFQTHLKWGEQKRVFSMIPGLENAEFVRYGVMHRNTYIDSPKLLKPTLELKGRENIMFAGQMTGVEGYIESASSGMVAGINMARKLQGKEPLVFPQETAFGALCHYITDDTSKNFQPMNVTFGIFPGLPVPPGKKKLKLGKAERYRLYAERALLAIEGMRENLLD